MIISAHCVISKINSKEIKDNLKNLFVFLEIKIQFFTEKNI